MKKNIQAESMGIYNTTIYSAHDASVLNDWASMKKRNGRSRQINLLFFSRSSHSFPLHAPYKIEEREWGNKKKETTQCILSSHRADRYSLSDVLYLCFFITSL